MIYLQPEGHPGKSGLNVWFNWSWKRFWFHLVWQSFDFGSGLASKYYFRFRAWMSPHFIVSHNVWDEKSFWASETGRLTREEWEDIYAKNEQGRVS